MNNADIEAARRLIEQFEGNALGRHNSSLFRSNPVAPQPAPLPEQRRRVVVKDSPGDCVVGDYCWSVRNTPTCVPVVRFLPAVPSEMWAAMGTPTVDHVVTWEFERVKLVNERWPDRPREAWRRIA